MSDYTTSGSGPSAGAGKPVETEDFTRLINALFDTREDADKARQDLVAAGIPGDNIVISGAEAAQTRRATEEPEHKEGFWETLKEIFMPEEDRFSYDEGMRRGGFTVAVRSDSANHDRIVDILDRDGAIDLDEREQSWRNEGWTGYTDRDPLVDSRGIEPGSIPPVGEQPSYTPPSNATAGFTASEADHFPAGEAPAVPSPGALPASERTSTPDETYAGAAPGLSPNPGAPAVPSTADGAGTVASDTAPVAPSRVGMRDLSVNRPRIRSYTTGSDTDGAPPVG